MSKRMTTEQVAIADDVHWVGQRTTEQMRKAADFNANVYGGDNYHIFDSEDVRHIIERGDELTPEQMRMLDRWWPGPGMWRDVPIEQAIQKSQRAFYHEVLRSSRDKFAMEAGL